MQKILNIFLLAGLILCKALAGDNLDAAATAAANLKQVNKGSTQMTKPEFMLKVDGQGTMIGSDDIAALLKRENFDDNAVKNFGEDIIEMSKRGDHVWLKECMGGRSDECYFKAWEELLEEGVDATVRRNIDALADPDAALDAVQISGKFTWHEIQALWKRGNDFNKKARNTYDYNEIVLQGVNGKKGKRLDTYVPPTPGNLGKIISRKATDIDNISESTWRNYCQELVSKYKAGTPINSTKLPNEPPLSGKYYLEIPASNQTAQKLETFKAIAKEYGTQNHGGIDVIFLVE